MKKAIVSIAICAACATPVRAALPTLSGLFDGLETLRDKFEESTNNLAQLRADFAQLRENYAESRARIAAFLELVEQKKDLRETFHGGRIGQYVVTNDAGCVKLDLYGDGTAYTNAPIKIYRFDPETAAKAKAKAEAIRAEWERKNLPPDVAALLQARRDAANGK